MAAQRGSGYIRPSICEEGIQLLLEVLGLTGSSFTASSCCVVVLIAIHFEHTASLRDGFYNSENSQTGLSTLDTRDLGREDLRNIISTYISSRDHHSILPSPRRDSSLVHLSLSRQKTY